MLLVPMKSRSSLFRRYAVNIAVENKSLSFLSICKIFQCLLRMVDTFGKVLLNVTEKGMRLDSICIFPCRIDSLGISAFCICCVMLFLL